MPSSSRLPVTISDPEFARALEDWCARYLGAWPAGLLFERVHLSAVIGFRMSDGREVVVKVREPSARLVACVQVQKYLWKAGYPCPQPLAGPAPIGALTGTAETMVPGGEQLGANDDSPRLFAEALAELVHRAPSVISLPTLDPTPPWVGWDHNELGTWPPPDDRDADLNDYRGPAWLDDLARRVRQRLTRCRQPRVVGHADWESQNIRWAGRDLYVVHDWDSVVALPEAAIAGAAAAVFPFTGALAGGATLEETAAFLTAYEHARNKRWSDDEKEVCWAAGLWVSAFNAKKATLDGEGNPILARLAREGTERTRRAGVGIFHRE